MGKGVTESGDRSVGGRVQPVYSGMGIAQAGGCLGRGERQAERVEGGEREAGGRADGEA